MLTSEHTNLDDFETGFNLTPHDTDKEKKSTALRKRAAQSTSLVLSSEENPPRKRIRPNTETALLDPNLPRKSETPITSGNLHFGVHPILLVRSVTLPVGTEPTVWKPPTLLQIVSHPTPDLVRKLATSHVPYVSSPACQTYRK